METNINNHLSPIQLEDLKDPKIRLALYNYIEQMLIRDIDLPSPYEFMHLSNTRRALEINIQACNIVEIRNMEFIPDAQPLDNDHPVFEGQFNTQLCNETESDADTVLDEYEDNLVNNYDAITGLNELRENPTINIMSINPMHPIHQTYPGPLNRTFNTLRNNILTEESNLVADNMYFNPIHRTYSVPLHRTYNILREDPALANNEREYPVLRLANDEREESDNYNEEMPISVTEYIQFVYGREIVGRNTREIKRFTIEKYPIDYNMLKNKNRPSCSICLETPRLLKQAISQCCLNTFCITCINDWETSCINNNSDSTCPLCRKIGPEIKIYYEPHSQIINV